MIAPSLLSRGTVINLNKLALADSSIVRFRTLSFMLESSIPSAVTYAAFPHTG